MATIAMVNPRRKKARRKHKISKKIRRNPRKALARRASVAVRRSGRKVRRGVAKARAGRGQLSLMGTVQNGAIAGLGAIGAEAIVGLLPVPETLKAGPMKHVASAAIGIGAGWAIAKFLNKTAGQAVAEGAVTMATYNALRPMLAGKVPGLAGYHSDLLGEYVDGYHSDLLGEYVSEVDYGDDAGMSAWQSAAPVYAYGDDQ